MKSILVATMLAVVVALTPGRAQAPDPADLICRAYYSNVALAQMFNAYAAYDSVYLAAARYFEGRASGFADAYLILTGTPIE